MAMLPAQREESRKTQQEQETHIKWTENFEQ